jgi:hypothetical protein
MRNVMRKIQGKFWYLVSYRHFVKQGFHPTQASVIAKNIAILKTQKIRRPSC